MRTWILVLAWAAAGVGAVGAQVEIDRTLVRIYGVALMASDVRQARLLHLVTAADDGDRAIQTALENRLLMLREASRGGGPAPDADLVAARRAAWTAALPPGFDAAAAMTRAGMSSAAMAAWFGDDVRIEGYVTRRFGQEGDPRRAERVDEWIRDLRHRAGLDRS